MSCVFTSSIREFCDLDMPIFMFDKDKNCRVMRLREVCNAFGQNLSGDDLSDAGNSSCCPYPLGLKHSHRRRPCLDLTEPVRDRNMSHV